MCRKTIQTSTLRKRSLFRKRMNFAQYLKACPQQTITSHLTSAHRKYKTLPPTALSNHRITHFHHQSLQRKPTHHGISERQMGKCAHALHHPKNNPAPTDLLHRTRRSVPIPRHRSSTAWKRNPPPFNRHLVASTELHRRSRQRTYCPSPLSALGAGLEFRRRLLAKENLDARDE